MVFKILFLLSGIYNPYEFEPPHSGGSEITHQDAPQTVELLWTSDQPVAHTSTWQHTQHSHRTTIHAPGGIRTHNPSKRSGVDTRLRPFGHWDQRFLGLWCHKNPEDRGSVCLRNFSTDLPICTIRQLRRLRYEMRLHGNVSSSCLSSFFLLTALACKSTHKSQRVYVYLYLFFHFL